MLAKDQLQKISDNWPDSSAPFVEWTGPIREQETGIMEDICLTAKWNPGSSADLFYRWRDRPRAVSKSRRNNKENFIAMSPEQPA